MFVDRKDQQYLQNCHRKATLSQELLGRQYKKQFGKGVAEKKKLVTVYLDWKAGVYIFTRVQAIISGLPGALRGERYVMVNVLAPLHKHMRVGIVFTFDRTPHDLFADFLWLLKFNIKSCKYFQ